MHNPNNNFNPTTYFHQNTTNTYFIRQPSPSSPPPGLQTYPVQPPIVGYSQNYQWNVQMSYAYQPQPIYSNYAYPVPVPVYPMPALEQYSYVVYNSDVPYYYEQPLTSQAQFVAASNAYFQQPPSPLPSRPPSNVYSQETPSPLPSRPPSNVYSQETSSPLLSRPPSNVYSQETPPLPVQPASGLNFTVPPPTVKTNQIQFNVPPPTIKPTTQPVKSIEPTKPVEPIQPPMVLPPMQDIWENDEFNSVKSDDEKNKEENEKKPHQCKGMEKCEDCRAASKFLLSGPFPASDFFGDYNIFGAPMSFIDAPTVDFNFAKNSRIYPSHIRNRVEGRPTPPAINYASVESMLSKGIKMESGIQQLATQPQLDVQTNVWNILTRRDTVMTEKSLEQLLRNVIHQQNLYNQRQSPYAVGQRSRKFMCNFCKDKGAPIDLYTDHNMMDLTTGKPICPYLRSQICLICGGTGDNAHLVRNCPSRAFSQLNSPRVP